MSLPLPAVGAVIIGGATTGPSYRRETCDDCLTSIYLAPKIQRVLDDLEDTEAPAVVLCTPCAMNRYGPGLAAMIDQSDKQKEA